MYSQDASVRTKRGAPWRPGMVRHRFNPRAWESEAGRLLFEFKASLVYRVSSKLAAAA